MGARAKNIGWRLDYFVVSERMKDQITEAKINSEVMGSDHCPVELHINLKRSISLKSGGYFLIQFVKIFQIILEIISY